jgi:hypothetical protein
MMTSVEEESSTVSAARASVFFVDRDEDKDGAFVQDMVWYSTLALRLARDHSLDPKIRATKQGAETMQV